jgi:L-seryl-tRNA(Ser) seleniumtransferase
LVEVGTTNRTYARDYLDAIDESTAVLLKVHPSNFSIEGFTATTTVEELAEIGRERGIPVVEDLGSGALMDTRPFGLRAEPTIGGSLAAGATLVTASGDKLLGGPQAGIIAGSAKWVRLVERHPLARAVRADKTCLAGVAETLRHYVKGDVTETIPVWRMVSATVESLWERGEAIAAGLAVGFAPPDPPVLGGDDGRRSSSLKVEVVRSEATIGGGSLPGQKLESVGIGLSGDGIDLDGVARRLRMGEPRVFSRIADGKLILDLRTVLAEDDGVLVGAVTAVLSVC